MAPQLRALSLSKATEVASGFALTPIIFMADAIDDNVLIT
jgi:hypothetical protein